MNGDRYDVAVLGAGSGGIGAALAAARAGLEVLLVEQADTIGGTATRAGVHCWEPGAGGTGAPFDIYKRLKEIPDAVGIYDYARHGYWPGEDGPSRFHGGERVTNPQRRYADTLNCLGAREIPPEQIGAFARARWHGVPFEPVPYCRVVEGMLAETGCCTLIKGVGFARAESAPGHVTSLELQDGQRVQADLYVDATAEVALAQACGCETMIGQEGRDTFGEPDAPEEANGHLNGVTLIYRVTPAAEPLVEPLPEGIYAQCWWQEDFPGAVINLYPCGDLNINMLPTMDGRTAFDMGYPAAYADCRRRVLAHWHHVQAEVPEYRPYRLRWIAPALGVRGGRRVVGECVLTEHDLLAGLSRQTHQDIVAIADHSMDVHGATPGRKNSHLLDEPYGVPYRCLIPRGFDNLLVACRGASFSSIAASSCRLSRTVMQLGQAAGTAAVLARERGTGLAEVPPAELRARLRAQHVQLEWPLPDDLEAYLRLEDPSRDPNPAGERLGAGRSLAGDAAQEVGR